MASWFPRATPGSHPQPPALAPYDELDPKSEWKDEPAANVLNVYLPGFVKDQIKVRFDQVTKTLNVSAERPGGNNRTIRVNEGYIIPGNSNLEDMRAKLEDQTLKIIISKETTSQVDPNLREPTKTSQEPSSTQKPRSEKSPTPPAAPPPPPPRPREKQKPEEKPARIPSLLPDPWHEMAEGRDFPDPNALKGKTRAKFIKDEDENKTPTAPPTSTQNPLTEKSPTPPAAPPPPPPSPLKKQKPEEKPARIPYILPDPWHEMAEGRDFPDPNVLLKNEDESETPTSPGTEDTRSSITDDEEIGRKGKKSHKEKIWLPEERKEPIPEKRFSWKGPKVGEGYYSEQEMKMSNDIPGSEEEETLPNSSGEETDIYAAARKAMMDLTTRIKEDRQLVINVGVAALIIVALGSYFSSKIGLSGEGDDDW